MTWNLLHLARMLKDAGGIPAHGNQRSAWDAGCRFDYPNPELPLIPRPEGSATGTSSGSFSSLGRSTRERASTSVHHSGPLGLRRSAAGRSQSPLQKRAMGLEPTTLSLGS